MRNISVLIFFINKNKFDFLITISLFIICSILYNEQFVFITGSHKIFTYDYQIRVIQIYLLQINPI